MSHPPRPRASVHLILVLSQICFASMAVVGRLAMADTPRPLPPNAIVLVRIAGGAVAFWLIARAGGPVTAGLRRGDLPRLVAAAVLGVVVNQFLFLNGLERTTAVNASVIGATIPLYTALGAILVGAEKARAARLAGIAVALAGILVLVRVETFSFGDDHAVGNLMILVNALSYGIFLVVVKPLAARIKPMALVALLFVIALPFATPIALPSLIAVAPTLEAREIALLAYFVAVPTVGAYALTQLAIERADSSLVALYIYLQPVLATVGAVLLLGERPGPRTFVAAAIIGIGMAIASRRAAKLAAPPQP